jgi:hypothetical protein
MAQIDLWKADPPLQAVSGRRITSTLPMGVACDRPLKRDLKPLLTMLSSQRDKFVSIVACHASFNPYSLQPLWIDITHCIS